MSKHFSRSLKLNVCDMFIEFNYFKTSFRFFFSIIFIKDALPQSGTMGHKTEHVYRSLNQKQIQTTTDINPNFLKRTDLIVLVLFLLYCSSVG